MQFIKDKMNNINGDIGFLFAPEFNSLKNELANVVKYRYSLNDTDNYQLMRSIVTESKTLFYEDQGTVNHINLVKDGEIDFKLVDKQTFLFAPANVNTGPVYLRVGTNEEKELIMDNAVVPAGFLNKDVTYMAVYSGQDDRFTLRNLTIGTVSDFVFTSMHNQATFIEVGVEELASNLTDDDTVYLDQNTGVYGKAEITNPKTQKQNAIGILKVINNKTFVFFDGIVPEFNPTLTAGTLKSGMKYYLAESQAGKLNDGTEDNSIMIGRYIKNGKFLLNISGNVSIDADAPLITMFDTNMVDPETKEGNTFTNPTGEFILMFNKVAFDSTVPTLIMFASVEGITFKVDFAAEYIGNLFNIEYNGIRYEGYFTENEDYANPLVLTMVGEATEPTPTPDTTAPVLSSTSKSFTTTVGTNLTLETVTATDAVDGSISVTQTGTVDFNTVGTYSVIYSATDAAGNTSSITHTYIVNAAVVENTVYNTVLVNPETSEGNTFTDPSGTMSLMFDKVTYDASTPALIMFISVNGVIAKVDFAGEYVGDTFEIEISGTRYIGTFSENEDYSNPTIISVK